MALVFSARLLRRCPSASTSSLLQPQSSCWELRPSRHSFTSLLGDDVGSNNSMSSSLAKDCNQFEWSPESGSRYEQLKIVDALRLGDRERASKMLLNLGQKDGSLHAENFAIILDYCVCTPDPLFVMETWKFMKEKDIDVNKRCCRSILQALIAGGYFKEAFKWLTFLEETDNIAVLPLYNIYLKACINAQRLADANCCLELMECRLLGKSERTYWELLKLAVWQKNLSAVREIWQDCIRYYSPSIISLRKFIWSFTRLRDLESAYNVLQLMVALARQGSASLKLSATGRYQSSRLDIPIPLIGDMRDEWLKLNQCSLVNGRVKRKRVIFEQNSVNESIMENQLPENIGENITFQSLDLTPSDSSKTTANIFLEPTGSQPLNEEEIVCSNFQVLSSIDGSAMVGKEFLTAMGQFQLTTKTATKPGTRLHLPKEASSAPVMTMLRWSFNDLIHACSRSDFFELAEELLLQMHVLGLQPSQHTYDGFVKAVIRGKQVAYGMKVVDSLKMRNIKPYNDTLVALSVAYSKGLELELAEALLRRISYCHPKHTHAFNIFLAACNVMDEPERAVRVLAKMRHLDVKSNVKTYELLFSLFGNVNVPYEKGNILSKAEVAKRIKAIENDMMMNGIHHSYTSIKKLIDSISRNFKSLWNVLHECSGVNLPSAFLLIRALGAEGMIQEMLQYLDFVENVLWQTNSYQRTAIYTIVLHALVKAKHCPAATDVFKNLRLCNFPANIPIYNIMIECCSILRCYRSACALVSMMMRDGYCPQTMTYTSLMKVLLANEDFDGALKLLDQSKFEGIQPDIQLFNTILKQAYLKGRIDIIELMIERIHGEKIQPDPSTCWYTFSGYVEGGFHSTAMEALQVLSLHMISEDGTILPEKIAAFEELIYSEEPDAEAQIIEIFKDSQEFLATALLNLRFCAIAGASISWSPEDNPWSRRLCSSYSSRRTDL